MYISGQESCDLFLWSPVKNGSYCVNVKRNEVFLKEVIGKCEHFYYNDYLPKLCKDEKKTENKADSRRTFATDLTNVA